MNLSIYSKLRAATIFTLGDNYHRVGGYEKSASFERFLANRHVDMIVVSDRLLRDTRFKDDSEWQDFLVDYQQRGYLPNGDPKC